MSDSDKTDFWIWVVGAIVIAAMAQEQAGVQVAKTGAKYSIESMGRVIKTSGCKLALTGALNAL